MAVTERQIARDVTFNDAAFFNSTVVIHYLVDGAADEDAVNTQVQAFLTGYDSDGRLLQGYTIDERLGETNWYVDATYATPTPQQSQSSEPARNFSTNGGTVHITNSLSVTEKVPADPNGAPDNKGAIGFDGKTVNGVDIVTASLVWSEEEVVAAANVDDAYIRTLRANTGKTNDATYRGYDEGSLLYLGATGTLRSDGDYNVTHQFAFNENQTNINVGDLVVLEKKGWEVLDVVYGADDNPEGKVKVPKFAYVHQVYDSFDFSSLGLPPWS